MGTEAPHLLLQNVPARLQWGRESGSLQARHWAGPQVQYPRAEASPATCFPVSAHGHCCFQWVPGTFCWHSLPATLHSGGFWLGPASRKGTENSE